MNPEYIFVLSCWMVLDDLLSLIECKWSMKARKSPRCEMMWVPTNEEIILHVREIPCLVSCGWDQKHVACDLHSSQISRI